VGGCGAEGHSFGHWGHLVGLDLNMNRVAELPSRAHCTSQTRSASSSAARRRPLWATAIIAASWRC
jgi:hypothetical protein